MNRDLDKLRRRPFFFPLVVPILVFIALRRRGLATTVVVVTIREAA